MKEINNDNKETSFANYIINLRLERNLTQKALADKIQVSDRTISKWENGLTVPDLHNIRNICTELGVSANSIVLEKQSLSDYLRKFIKILKIIFKQIFNNIFKLIFIGIFILLLIYFINNYNSLNIYVLNYDSTNIEIANGYFIRSKVRNILMIDNIQLKNTDDEISSLTLELSTLVNGDKVVIYEDNKLDDIFIDELNSYPDAFRSDVIRSITNGIYLTITTYNEVGETTTYECTINFKENFSNNKLVYTSHQDNIEYNNDYQRFLNSKNNIVAQNISYQPFEHEYNNVILNKDDEIISAETTSTESNDNKLASLGYSYDLKSDTYTKIDDGKTITYQPKMDLLYNKQIVDDFEYNTYYYLDNNRIVFRCYHDFPKVNVYLKYFVDINYLECILGNCKNYQSEIDYILAEYQAISAIL